MGIDGELLHAAMRMNVCDVAHQSVCRKVSTVVNISRSSHSGNRVRTKVCAFGRLNVTGSRPMMGHVPDRAGSCEKKTSFSFLFFLVNSIIFNNIGIVWLSDTGIASIFYYMHYRCCLLRT